MIERNAERAAAVVEEEAQRPHTLGPKAVLENIFRAAVNAARGDLVLEERLSLVSNALCYRSGTQKAKFELNAAGRLIVIGAGKAAAYLALGLENILGDRIDEGRIIVKYGHGLPLKRIKISEAGHPIPDSECVQATRQILRLVSGLTPNDRVIVLITGGASALLVDPIPGLTLEEKIVVSRALLQAGVPIEELNALRQCLSAVKGGGLRAAIGQAQTFTLLISDIPSADPDIIGSGPMAPRRRPRSEVDAIVDRYRREQALTADVIGLLERCCAREMPDPRKRLPRGRQIVVANSGTALRAAVRRAEQYGYRTEVFDRDVIGDTHTAARRFAERIIAIQMSRKANSKPVACFCAGETTLQVRGKGRGGRNQEFALVLAEIIANIPNTTALIAGTDGTDGPTDAAGAFADSTTIARARNVGVRASESLLTNDSYNFFSAINDLFIPGPTGTNVMDLAIGLLH